MGVWLSTVMRQPTVVKSLWENPSTSLSTPQVPKDPLLEMQPQALLPICWDSEWYALVLVVVWEGNLTRWLFSFSKKVMLSPLPRAYNLPNHRVLARITVPGIIPPVEQDSNPIRQEFVTQITNISLLYQCSQTFLAGQCCSM